MQKKKELASEELYGELGKAFNFMTGDLEANRAGFITYRQAKIRRNAALRDCLAILIGTACMIGFLYGGMYVFAEGKWLGLIVFTVVTGIVPIGFIAIAFNLWRIVNIDLGRRLVESKICRKTTMEMRSGTSYVLAEVSSNYMSAKYYSISKDQFNILYGFEYRIYYLPRSREIVSLEEVLPE